MGRVFVRERWTELADEGPVIVFGAGLVLLSTFTGLGWPRVATLGACMLTVSTVDAVRSAAGVPEYGSGIVIGAGAAGYSASLLRTEFSWIAVAFCCIGAWFVLDACYEWRRGTRPPDSPAEELIAATLDESSTSLRPGEIADRTGLTLEAVERTLEERVDGGVIERVDDRYTVRERPTEWIDRRWNAIPRPLRPFSDRSWR